MMSWLTRWFGFWKSSEDDKKKLPVARRTLPYFSQGLRGNKVSPYRESAQSINKADYCTRCYTQADSKEGTERLFVPCPYQAPRPGALCGLCANFWIQENYQYCEPYLKLGLGVPVYEIEIMQAGRMSSMPFEWFYPDRLPGKGPGNKL